MKRRKAPLQSTRSLHQIQAGLDTFKSVPNIEPWEKVILQDVRDRASAGPDAYAPFEMAEDLHSCLNLINKYLVPK